MVSLSRSTYGVSDTAGCSLNLWSKNSPGRRRVVRSAAVHLRSALYTVRIAATLPSVGG